MKKSIIFTFMLAAFMLFSIKANSQTTAFYDITFNSIWNANDHTSIPNGAHWSRLVGANHNSEVSFYEIGQPMATLGIENIAEQGNNTAFNNEVINAMMAGRAQQYIFGNSLGSAIGDIIYDDLEVSDQFPLLTLVSMIAPSPDWFIGINSLNLRENNAWIESITVNLYAIDAGTDSGMNYDSLDMNNDEPISEFRNTMPVIAPFNNNIIGTLTITLDPLLTVQEINSVDTIKVFPNPSEGLINLTNIKNSELQSLKVYSILGNLVIEKSINTNANKLSIDLSHLNQGIYLLKLKTSSGNSTQKLIIK